MENFKLFSIARQEYEQEIANNEDLDNKVINDEEENDFCKHSDILEENGVKLCLDCGQEISRDISYEKEWRYYGSDDTRRSNDPNRCHPRKLEDKTIFKDLENLGFSDRIVNKANDVYVQITNGKIYRGKSRKSIISACVYHAFKMIDKPISFDSLNDIFQLERKNIQKGLKELSQKLPKALQIKNKSITPVHIIEETMTALKATKEQKEEVITIFEQIKNKSSMLNGSRPQSVASGLIYFYISNKCKDINPSDFLKNNKLSALTITKISKEVEKIIGKLNTVT